MSNKLVVVKGKYHEILKKRAREKGRWIQAEVDDIMRKELGDIDEGANLDENGSQE